MFEHGIEGKSNLPLPSILFMVLVRLRRGYTLELCKMELEYSDKNDLNELFWSCCTILVDNLLKTQRLWTNFTVSEEQMDTVFQNLMDNTDPLFSYVL